MAKDDLQKTDVQVNAVTALAHGVQTGSNLAASFGAADVTTKLKVLQTITEYVGADADSIDNLLNTRILVVGAVAQDVQVRAQQPVVQSDGSISEYQHGRRVVIKIKNGTTGFVYVSFVSMAVAGFFDNFMFPMFGMGDWGAEVPMLFRSAKNKTGDTYNVQVVA